MKNAILMVVAGTMIFVSAVNTQPVHAQNSGQSVTETSNANLMEEIVVSARRRDESIQDIPISVSAITEETITQVGISGVEALSLVTPNLQINREISQGGTPFLRGVGSPGAAAGAESPLAIYVDDVYIGSPNGNLFELNAIDNIQVFKGPQGTLFGRNATGGVIMVNTKRPTFDPTGEISLGYGNYDTIEGSFYGSTGLSDNVAVNLAASARDQQDGYGRSLLTGNETQLGSDWDVRGKLLWNVSEATTILLSADYSEQKSDIGSNASPVPGSVSLSGATFQGYNTEAAGDDEGRIDGGGVSLNITHETSLADYTSISAFRSTRLEFELDQDQGAAPSPAVQVGTIRSYYDAYSQEFRAGAKPESDIQWTVGLFYLNATTGYNPSEIFLDFTAFGAPATQRTFLYDEQVLNSYAVFGEASFELMPDTNLTAGIRYTKDDYDMEYEGKFFDAGKTTRFLDFRVFPPDPTEGEAFTQSTDFSKVTYRAILDHRFTEDFMGYFSYSRGFRSGGYSLAFPFFNGAPTPVVNPEVLDSFEIGFKSNFMDGNLVINGAAFLYDYENVVIGFVETGGNRNVNAAGAEIKGFELDIIATPFDNGFKLVAGIGVMDGEYTDFPDGPIATPTLIGGIPIGGNTISTGDLTGNDTIRTPDFTLNLTPSYTWDTEVGTFTAAANYYHNSGFAWDVSNRLTEPSYDVLNASLSWTSLNEKLNLRLWGRNLTDKQYAIYSAVSQLTDSYAPAAPLTWGVTGTFSF